MRVSLVEEEHGASKLGTASRHRIDTGGVRSLHPSLALVRAVLQIVDANHVDDGLASIQGHDVAATV
jgi:hypothetical protein